MNIRYAILLLLLCCSLNCEKKNTLNSYTKNVPPTTKLLTQDGGVKDDLAWSPDGSQIAFTERTTFNNFYEYLIKSNDYEKLHNSQPIIDEIKHFPRISPDKTKILYQKQNNNICIASLETGNIVHEFKPRYSISNPIWSADGSQVAFQYNTNNDELGIDICDTSGYQIKQIRLDNFTDIYTFTWSPDGSHFVGCCYTSDNKWDLWKIPVDGTECERLTNSSSADETFPEYSHDGKYIAFLNYRSNELKLKRLNVNSKSISTMTDNLYDPELDQMGDAILIWADDDSKLLYSAFKRYFNNYSSKWIYNFNDHSIDSLNYLSNYGHLFGWTETNESLIMYRKYDNNKNISTISISDSQYIRVTPPTISQGYRSPTWNKNADRITMLTSNYINVYNIELLNNQINRFGDFRSHSKINYSPDGKNFIFSYYGEIYIGVNQTEPEIKSLTDHLSYPLHEPVWSPDGEKIACRSRNSLKIFQISPDSLIYLKTIDGKFYDLAWSETIPNFGSFILYKSGYSEYDNFYAIDPDTEDRIHLLDGRNSEINSACWSPDGLSIAYSHKTSIYIKKIFYDLTAFSN